MRFRNNFTFALSFLALVLPLTAWAQQPGTILTIAGTGQPGYQGDGGPATAAWLDRPNDVEVDAAGTLYIADTGNNRIRLVTAEGLIFTLAGTGRKEYGGDGGPGELASFNLPRGLTLGQDGSIYTASADGHRVRRIDPGGVVQTVAGTGMPGYSGDGGPATEARMNFPDDVAVLADGTLIVPELYNNILRRIAPDGTISTLAGICCGGSAGSGGFSGDGGPALQARFDLPISVEEDAAGNLFVADTLNSRIRRIGLDGVINTVAGSGYDISLNGIGDDGPATDAILNRPNDAIVAADGSLFIADTFHSLIRKVTPQGIISTVVGTGQPGYSGDGGPAVAAQLNFPAGLAIDRDGNLYIADVWSHVIRKVIGIAAPGLMAGRSLADLPPAYKTGDLNGDLRITVLDATLSLLLAVEPESMRTERQRKAGDVNGDGQYNIQDTILILRRVVGLR